MKVEPAKIMKSATALPSLPAIATQIIELARDENASIGKVANLVNKDPAIACKVLRMVNSPLYVKPRQVEIVHQAIVIMGLKQTISIALSFSLVAAMQKEAGNGLDYTYFWKRTLLAATAAKVLGEFVGVQDLEELFLAALLQDVGMLAVDRAEPDFYAELGDAQYKHDELVAYEKARMEMDHAELGAEILKTWNLSERTWIVVRNSHNAKRLPEQSLYGKFARVVALSGVVADLFVNNGDRESFVKLGHLAYNYLNFDHENFQKVIERIAGLIPDIELLFSTSLVPAGAADSILEQAREILVGRNIDALQKVDRLQHATKALDSRYQILETSGYHDPITALYNRSYLDRYLEGVITASRKTGKPVTLVMIVTQGLRKANADYGHQAGDQMLRVAARAIKRCLPDSAVVARYAGGEFVAVVPGMNAAQVQERCKPLQQEQACEFIANGERKDLEMRLGLGMVTQGDGQDFINHQAFFRALEAKMSGRQAA